MADDYTEVRDPSGNLLGRFPKSMSKDEIKAALAKKYPKAAPDTQARPAITGGEIAAGIGKSAASGIPQGLEFMLNIPSYAADAMSWALEKPMGAIGLKRITPEEKAQIPDYYKFLMDRDLIGKGFEAATGGGVRYKPKTRAGKVTQAATSGLPMGAIGGARAAIVEGLLPSAASEVAGQVTEGSSLEPYARIAAGLLTPTAIEGGARMLKTGQLAVPARASDEALARDAALRGEGIFQSVGQIADDSVIMAREAATQFGRGMNQRQLEQFTSAVLRKAGINAPKATKEVMREGYERLGASFDDLASKSKIQIDEDFANAFKAPVDNYINSLSLDAGVPRNVSNLVDEFVGLQASGRVISGKEYQNITRKLRDMKKLKNPEQAALAKELEVVMKDALGNSIVAQGSDDLVKQWTTTNSQYRTLDTIARAVKDGVVKPNAILNVAKTKSGYKNVAIGNDELASLAETAKQIAPIPNTYTAPRSIAEGLMSGATPAGAAFGTALGAGGDLTQAITAGGAGATIGALNAARNRLTNEMISQPYAQEFLLRYLQGKGRPLASPLPIGGIAATQQNR